MITKAPAYATADGQSFFKLSDAQEHELCGILGIDKTDPISRVFVESAIRNKEKVVDVLTTTETTRSKARKINGGHKSIKTAPKTVT